MIELKQIKQENNINEEFINAKSMDKENRIFKSDSYIIKLYFPKKYNYYFNELEVYNGLKDKDYLPKIYYNGEHENYKYIVMEKLKGISLFDSWNKLSQEERINSVTQIATILKDINNIKTQSINFKREFEINFMQLLNNLDNQNLKKYFYDIFNKLIIYLKDEEECNLIHVDTHFYNFFYNNNKIYAYDFENTIMAPKDYQLLRWYRMWQHPEDFYYPKDSLTKKEIESYNFIMNTLLNNYSELKKINNLDSRVKLYALYYLLQETIRCNFSKEKVKLYIKRAGKEKIY